MSVYENFDEQKQFACRVIADHARTTAFSIADGILPGNEGRSYVLRKIMRRAIYHGREHLGFNDSFFYKVCNKVVDEMKEAYPELEVQRDFIGKMVRLEEERFGNTMTVGLKKLNELFTNYFTNECSNKTETRLKNYKDVSQALNKILISVHNEKVDLTQPQIFNKRLVNWRDYWREQFLSGMAPSYDQNDVDNQDFILSEYAKELESPENIQELIRNFAKLYDTFGIPKDLIFVSLQDREFNIAEQSFNEIFDKAIQDLQASSEVGKTKQKETLKPIYVAMERTTSIRSAFKGYETTQIENAKVIAIVKDDQQINELNEGEEGLIVLNETPFYAESGGQVGDAGFLTNETSRAKVQDTFSPVAGLILHKSKVEKGSVKIGDEVIATVDAEKRDATRRNHTATHLVHAALREVLGTHVKQAGSVVAPNYLRFDFTHYQPISSDEIQQIEDLVNREILKNDVVNTDVKSIEEAMQSGAMALFGEKYGSQVRVLSIGEGIFSKELCGGTHVRATGDIGSFKILSDEAVASGVRRIRAITGLDAFARFREDEKLIEKSLGALKTQRDNLPNAIERLQDELKRARREVDEMKMKIATGAFSESSANGDEARDVKGIKVVAKVVENLDANAMRQLSDNLLNKLKSGVIVLGRRDEAKVSIIVRVSDDLTAQVKAGNIIKELAPKVGGRGGGKPDMAEGGGSEPEKLSEAIGASYDVIEQMLK